MNVKADPIRPGQESVWAFPRPAIAEPCQRRLKIVHRGITLAETHRGVRTLETSHPPGYYFPPGDVNLSLIQPSARRSFCEWKGNAAYFNVVIQGETLGEVGWSYPDPTPTFECLRDYLAFYAGPFESCFVDEERVIPQPGGFYGGWITPHVAGPFKGVPGSTFW